MMFMTRFIGSKRKSISSQSSIGSSCGFEELNTTSNTEDYVVHDDITNSMLLQFNCPQDREGNYQRLKTFGGVEHLISQFEIDINKGLEPIQVLNMKHRFGVNSFPIPKMHKFYEFLFDALSDSTLIILLIAAALSIIVGTIQNPQSGYTEGLAIYFAVFLAATIGACNDYSKQNAFRNLELSAQQDERCSCLRSGKIENINPSEIVVGDVLILQTGDLVSADCIIITKDTVIESDESSLTGEAKSVKKGYNVDPFLLSSCMISDGEKVKCIVIGIGKNSQWGKIKENLIIEPVSTPLQIKLEKITKLIGYVGFAVAVATAASLIINIWYIHHGKNIGKFLIQALLTSVTVVVVAVPEGLPLAVTISLAYCARRMYREKCFIRVLAACETMGNCTTILSDKTGTLTENKMTVVEGYFSKYINQNDFREISIHSTVKSIIVDHISVNRSCHIIYNDDDGHQLFKPKVIGSKTEGALLGMIRKWGIDEDLHQKRLFSEDAGDKLYSFNSLQKSSTAVIRYSSGEGVTTHRVFIKGASEILLENCSHYLNEEGNVLKLDIMRKQEILDSILSMSSNALRTLLLAHKDIHINELPLGWDKETTPPHHIQTGLCCDCVVGIIDPLREDVYDAVAKAQAAGVMVRMVTGDNIITAKAIAKKCGILTRKGIAIEGPAFRKMTPRELDSILPRLQIIARSSPEDKFLLVSRLNGYALPTSEADWKLKHPNNDYETEKDLLLPGYKYEWQNRRSNADIVAVTGDGTNDAPALKAADVGLAMGITGTKVAQGASDIILLDDKFSSIVNAMLWGRSVFDNIRKFLQFQLTVNISALAIVFTAAISGLGEPITAVQMLWVNLIMDTLGALALATEKPKDSLLKRKPYNRTTYLISRPMWRNILFQSVFQICIVLLLMFNGPRLFNVNSIGTCLTSLSKSNQSNKQLSWNPVNQQLMNDWNGNSEYSLKCSSIADYCGTEITQDCYNQLHLINNNNHTMFTEFTFSTLENYDECLTCIEEDYTLSTIIFNFFIFCQLFNEISSRSLTNEVDFFDGILKDKMFSGIIALSVLIQIFIVTLGGSFMKTKPLNSKQWLITILLASITLLIGVFMRYIPIEEDPGSYFTGKNIINIDLNDEGSGYTMESSKSTKSICKKSNSKSKSRNESKELTEELTANLLNNV